MKLRFTQQALADIDEIAAYVVRHSPQGARKVKSAIEQALDLITAYPGIGRLQSLRDVRKIRTRRYSYHIYYKASADSITVLSVRHASRKSQTIDA